MPDAPPLVIVNPTAGGGRPARIVGWLRNRPELRGGGLVEVTSRSGEAESLAARAGARGYRRVIVVGGDGTIQEVVNGLLAAPAPPSLGIVPLGSGNDLARSLGLPTDTGRAWRVAVGAAERRVDVAVASGNGGTRRFASAGGIGFDAQVAAAMAVRRGWQRGRAGYLLTTLGELRRFVNRRVRLSVDGTVITRDVLFVAIANGAYYGGGMKIAPGASLDDGMLDLCVVGDVSRLTALRQIPGLYRGTHVRHPAVEMLSGRQIEVEGDEETRIHLDGEPWGGLPMRIRVEPSALVVAAPPRV
ncbi:MAG TPA: diacylglycerol kinase family protein [Methylomirabilota bacterium]|nr:diacylglycerol kinase family protein [Methylomirabilota bacterium]